MLREIALKTRWEHPLFPITVSVYEREMGGALEVSVEWQVPDRERPGETTKVRGQEIFTRTQLHGADRSYLRHCVRRIVQALYMHEFEEWLVLDGERCEPHRERRRAS